MTRSTVFITGASTGFGRDTALAFHRRGWNVVATMRSPEAAGELAALPGVLVSPLDVEDRATIDAAVAAAIARFGALDAVINNAGFGLHGVFEETPRDQIARQFAVNLFGAMDVTRAVLPHLRSRRRGVIVNVSSGAGVFTLPMLSLYCASKFALEGWSEGLSYELASQGITVKIVEPGGVVETGFIARGTHEASHQVELADYAGFKAATAQIFADMVRTRSATSAGVAEVIFAATTDGTPQLRYVATEDIKPLVAARRETSEAAYMAMMRGQFQRG